MAQQSALVLTTIIQSRHWTEKHREIKIPISETISYINIQGDKTEIEENWYVHYIGDLELT